MKTWIKTTIGLAFTMAALVGVSAPAYATTVSKASTTTSATVSSRSFIGIGGSQWLTSAMAQAEGRAFSKAEAAGASDCELTSETIDDTDPYFYVVFATVTCSS